MPLYNFRLTPVDVVKYFLELTGAKMIAVTNGSKDAILGTENHVSVVLTCC